MASIRDFLQQSLRRKAASKSPIIRRAGEAERAFTFPFTRPGSTSAPEQIMTPTPKDMLPVSRAPVSPVTTPTPLRGGLVSPAPSPVERPGTAPPPSVGAIPRTPVETAPPDAGPAPLSREPTAEERAQARAQGLTFVSTSEGWKLTQRVGAGQKVVGTLDDLRAGLLGEPQDISSRLESFRGQQIAGLPSLADQEASLAKTEADRIAAAQARIREAFNRLEGETRTEFENIEKGIRAGLGITEALNWTSTGSDEVKQNTQSLMGELAKITSRELEALATVDEQSAGRVRENLFALAKERRARETQVFENFRELIDTEIKQRTEDRLAKGQKETTENQQRDDARAVINKMLEMFAGADLANLPENVQEEIRTQAELAGFPMSIIEQGMKTLKETKQEQANDIAQGKLTLDEAELEQKSLIAQMNAAIRATLGLPAGTIGDFPLLGEILGTKTKSRGGGGAAGGETKFTPSELKKLEQAGKLNSPRQEQLDFLFGKGSAGNLSSLRALFNL